MLLLNVRNEEGWRSVHPHDDEFEWNVVTSVHEEGFSETLGLMRQFGSARPTDYHNLLVLRVDDIDAFVATLGDRVREEPGWLNSISRVAPARHVFNFEDPAEFQERAKRGVLTLVPELMGKSFHVRIHRRGFKHRTQSQEAERYLDGVILNALEEAGSDGSIAFEDPDAILAIDTLDRRAGLSLWTREDMERYPFLGLD